ncbi:MAG: Uma2 family endonuclease [Firmicutes bacterium]|nr:Uma2 family endonuclease [Bacillota bacterium]
MDLETMRKCKAELGYTNVRISELSGVPLGTVNKVLSGETASPRYDTILALEKVFAPVIGRVREEMAAEDDYYRYNSTGYEGFMDKESYEKWPDQGNYTLDDYYSFTDDVRVELIDGVIFEIAAPTKKHQIIVGELYFRFLTCVKSNKVDCNVYISPVDVRLDMNERTIVQPDIAVICHDDKNFRRIEGAPEFVVEVISPSTRGKDRVLKLNKYMYAGVKEYWIVDPYKEEVEVFIKEKMNNEEFPVRYTFDDKIPVVVSNGKCVIDFEEIKHEIEGYHLEDEAY